MIHFFIYFGILLLATNTIVYFKGFFKNEKAFKIFVIYNAVMLFIQVISLLFSLKGINNIFLSHFYFILQFILLSSFYFYLINHTLQKRAILYTSSTVLVILLLQYIIYPDLIYKFNLLEVFLTSFAVILYSTLHLYNMLNSKKTYYYINLGILIYLFGSTVLFLTGNLIAALNSSKNQLTWTLNAVLYVVYQLFILFEWKKSKK